MTAPEGLRHFAIPIYAQKLEGFASIRDELRDLLLAKRATEPSHDLTNRLSWHSTRDVHQWTEPCVAALRDALFPFLRGALRDAYGPEVQVEPLLAEAWAVVGGRGAFHVPHQHFPVPWSGVVYIDVERAVDPNPQGRGGKIEFLSPIAAPQAFGVPTGVVYTPADGLALLFPGALTHLVHPNETDALRICIGFNVETRPR